MFTLKFLIPDPAGGENHIVRWSAGPTEPVVIPAANRMLTAEQVEFGGPLFADEPTEPYEDDEHRRTMLLDSVWQQIPSVRGGWGDCYDFTSRASEGIEHHHPDRGVWWVKLYNHHAGVPGGAEVAVALHDARAFLCDAQGQTLEKLGPG